MLIHLSGPNRFPVTLKLSSSTLFVLFVCLFVCFVDVTILSRRDQRCNEKYIINSPSCAGSMKALFDRVNSTSGKMWRCYHACSIMKSPDHGGDIFNPGKDSCVKNAHEELLTIT